MKLFGRGSPDLVVDTHPAQDDLPLRHAHDAALAGDDRPARDLIAAVRHDYDRRARVAWVLSETTTPALADGRLDTDAAWTDRWAAAEPENPDALLMRARSLIARGWAVRGTGWASTVKAAAAEEFGRVLRMSAPILDHAAALAPADPTPRAVRLLLMTALGADRGTFERAWADLAARDPWHREAHGFRLMYHCRKWCGSHEEMFGFARAASAAAPEGSPLHVLPLHAYAEWEMWKRSRDNLEVTGYWRSDAGFRYAVDTALNRWFRRPAGRHAMCYIDLNQLAYSLSRAGRHAEAGPVFQAIGPYLEETPWAWWGNRVSAEDAFRKARRRALSP